jgi:FYVE zinc finger
MSYSLSPSQLLALGYQPPKQSNQRPSTAPSPPLRATATANTSSSRTSNTSTTTKSSSSAVTTAAAPAPAPAPASVAPPSPTLSVAGTGQYPSTNKSFRKALTQQIHPVWVPDDFAKHCLLCYTSFTFFRRRHHCRNCGSLVCGSCSKARLELPFVSPDRKVRVCIACVHQIEAETMADATPEDAIDAARNMVSVAPASGLAADTKYSSSDASGTTTTTGTGTAAAKQTMLEAILDGFDPFDLSHLPDIVQALDHDSLEFKAMHTLYGRRVLGLWHYEQDQLGMAARQVVDFIELSQQLVPDVDFDNIPEINGMDQKLLDDLHKAASEVDEKDPFWYPADVIRVLERKYSHQWTSDSDEPYQSVLTADSIQSILPLSETNRKTVIQIVKDFYSHDAIVHLQKEWAGVQKLVETLIDDQGWEEITCANGIKTLFRYEPGTPTITLKTLGSINAPVFNVLAIVNEVDLLETFIPRCKTRVLKQVSRFRQLAYGKVNLPWPFADREDIIEGRGVDLFENRAVVILLHDRDDAKDVWHGVQTPDPDGAQRIEMHMGGALIVPRGPENTFMCGLANIDPKISFIPTSLLNFINKHIAYYGFVLFRKKTRRIKGSEHEKRIKEKVEIYGEVRRRLDLYRSIIGLDIG